MADGTCFVVIGFGTKTDFLAGEPSAAAERYWAKATLVPSPLDWIRAP